MRGENVSMCRMLYLASNMRLPKISRNSENFIAVREIEGPSPSRQRFSKEHVYYVGAYDGCGCGFYIEQNMRSMGMGEEEQKRRNSIRHFFEYLATHVPLAGEFEVLYCWSGEEDKPFRREDYLHLRDFDPTDFQFVDNHFIKTEW